jgi:hypothetical protein
MILFLWDEHKVERFSRRLKCEQTKKKKKKKKEKKNPKIMHYKRKKTPRWEYFIGYYNH